MSDIPDELRELMLPFWTGLRQVTEACDCKVCTEEAITAICNILIARDMRAARIVRERQQQASKFLEGVQMGNGNSWSARGAIAACNDIERDVLDSGNRF